MDRLRRSVIEASKQCGRNRLMEISDPQAWPEFARAKMHPTLRLLAHPPGAFKDEESADRVRGSFEPSKFERHEPIPHRNQRDVCIAVGPEGGWTDDEIALGIEAGWQVVDLGSRVLRVETAAVAIAAALALQ